MDLEQYNDWKRHLVTEDITKALIDMRDDMIESLGNGHTLGTNTERETALLVGKIAGLNYFINHHYEDAE